MESNVIEKEISIASNEVSKEIPVLDNREMYKGDKGDPGYTPIKGVDYFDGKYGKDGVDGKDGYTPVKGVDYFDGEQGPAGKDGYTPVKGVDYFDGKDGQDGYTPVKGKDYFDGKDGVDGYTPVKGKDYFDGKDGKDGKDGSDADVTAENIKSALGYTPADKTEVDTLSEEIEDLKENGTGTGSNGILYGVCSTASNGKNKEVDIDGFTLKEGVAILVKFTASNSIYAPTLNVNGTGAIPMCKSGNIGISAGSDDGWAAGAVILLVYDGTSWVRDYWTNTVATNPSLGGGYAICSTEEEATSKTCALSGYLLTKGGIVTVNFTNAVPANSTLNINTRGAKAIHYRGSAIEDGIISAGDTATFIYDGSVYHLLSTDRPQSELEDLSSYDLVLEIKGVYIPGSFDRSDVVIASGSITDTFEKVNAGSKANIVLISSSSSYDYAFYTDVAQEVSTSTVGEKSLYLVFALSSGGRLMDISITVDVNNESIRTAHTRAYAVESDVNVFQDVTKEALDLLEENVASNTQQISDITSTVNILKPMIESTGGSDTLEIPAISENSYIILDMYYHISDATPTMSDFANGCVVTATTGEMTAPLEVSVDYIFEEPISDTASAIAIFMPDLFSDGPMFFVFPEDNMGLPVGEDDNGNPIIITIEKKGIYALPISMLVEGAYWVSLQIPNYLGFGGGGSYVLKDYIQKDELEELTPSIVQAVLAELQGSPVFGVVDAENNITISGNLANGTYTLKYENADGTTTEIGTLTVGQVAPVDSNVFDPTKATLNQRWSNSSYAWVAENGYVVSDYIPVSLSTDESNPTMLHFRGGTYTGNAHLVFYDSSKSIKGSATASTNGVGMQVNTTTITTDENGDYQFKLGYKNNKFDSNWTSGVAYMRVGLQVNTSGTAITAADIQGIKMTINELIAD